jgi:hypothetical protein
MTVHWIFGPVDKSANVGFGSNTVLGNRSLTGHEPTVRDHFYGYAALKT